MIYTRNWCSYCWRLGRLLRRKGYAFRETDLTGDPEGRAWWVRTTGRDTVQQGFVGVCPSAASTT